jgi:hypothetical protein
VQDKYEYKRERKGEQWQAVSGVRVDDSSLALLQDVGLAKAFKVIGSKSEKFNVVFTTQLPFHRLQPLQEVPVMEAIMVAEVIISETQCHGT